MKKADKNKIIETLTDALKATNTLYLADISNMNVETTGKLRRLCFKKDIRLVVVKNKLLWKAMENSGKDFSQLYPILNGHTSLLISEVANEPARLIKEFRKKFDKPILKGAYVQECCYIGDSQLDVLANLKSKNELIGDIVFMLQSPIKNVISALQSGQNTIAGLVKALSEKEN
ncbi:MAG: 50S ribosomal protein L10 [Bacteroidota bacterium]